MLRARYLANFEGLGRLPFALFILTFLGILIWFHSQDFYRNGFSVSGISLVLYTFFRTAFIVYLLAIFYGTGSFLVGRMSTETLTTTESVAVRLFAGIGGWHLLLFILGILGLLRWGLLALLTTLVLLVSYAHFATLHARVKQRAITVGRSHVGNPWFRVAVVVSFVFLVLIGTVLLIIKGLFPGGGHDYFLHYFQFYKEVVTSGSIWPNDVWYHFYYSKGAGVFFLAMVLTDPLAPQLATMCMMISAGIAMAALLGLMRFALPVQLITVALFLAIYIYTPGPPENMRHGGWGDFEKLHELQTALVVFNLYVLVRLLDAFDGDTLKLRIGAVLANVAAVLITPPMAAFYLGGYGLLFLTYALRRQAARAKAVGLLALSVLAAAATVLLFNQLASGLASDQGLRLFWKLANFDRVAQWGVLPELIRLHAWHTGAAASAGPLLNADTLSFLTRVFRIDLTYPLLLLPAIGVVAFHYPRLQSRRSPAFEGQAVWGIASFAISGVVVGILFGQAQHISFYRFSSFLVPIPLLLCLAVYGHLWRLEIAPSSAERSTHTRTLGNALASFCVLLSFVPVFSLLASETFLDMWRIAASYAAGRRSTESAYTAKSWPGRMPFGAIHPGTRTATGLVPKGERVRSFHVHSYCMVPDCKVESHMSYRLGADYNDTLYGSASAAMNALRAGRLNYFIISTDLAIQDPLAKSALFDPDSISQTMGVVWTDGVTALLTWRGSPNTTEIASPWLTAYRARVAESKIDLASMHSPDMHISLILTELKRRGSNQDLRDLNWYGGVKNLLPEPNAAVQ